MPWPQIEETARPYYLHPPEWDTSHAHSHWECVCFHSSPTLIINDFIFHPSTSGSHKSQYISWPFDFNAEAQSGALETSFQNLLSLGWFVWPTEHHKGAELPNPINQPNQVHAHDPFTIHAFFWTCELWFLDLGHAVDCWEISEIGMYLFLFQISLFGIQNSGTTKMTASVPYYL